LTVYNYEFILGGARVGSEMINLIATNTIGYYCLLKVTRHITSSLLKHGLEMSSSSEIASGRR